MTQFNVYRTTDGALLLDCQSEAFDYLSMRLVAPLLPIARAPDLQPRLNPTFEIDGERYAMMTQFAAAVSGALLRSKMGNLAASRLSIIGAFDMLLTGV